MAIDYEKISSVYVTVDGKHKKVVTIYEVQNGVYVKVYNAITYITTIPSQSGSLTYTGSALTPIWSNYDSTQLTIGGTTSSTNAGTYTATFTPKSGYAWSDGSTSAKSVSWTIGKASGSLSISPTSMTLNNSTKSKTITVTRSGNGTISATSSNTSVAIVSVSGTTVTVTGKATGSATITVKVAAGTNHTAPSNKTCSVSVSFIDTTLNNNSWATISSVASSGQASNYWSVGDRKAVTVSGTVGTLSVSGTYYVYIIGFNHNGATNTIDFGTFKTALSGGKDVCLVDSLYDSNSTSGTKYFNMNHSSNTSVDGWAGCDLRYDILGSTKTKGSNAATNTATSPVSGTLMAALPSDLRAVMKPMTIYTDNNGNKSNTSSNVTATIDYLPLLAEFEVCGSRTYANRYEKNYQKQYAYYSSGNSKAKYKHNATSTAALWQTRSAVYNYNYRFSAIDTDGSVYRNNARNALGIAPIFRI